jgi:hypothetical protein
MDFEEAGTAQSPTSPQETTPPRQRASGMLNQRMSNNLQNLPPQLRASVFFDPTPVAHDVEVKSESAVATLDSILAERLCDGEADTCEEEHFYHAWLHANSGRGQGSQETQK